MAKEFTPSYNPLFIWGGVGRGKTHLIQALGNFIKKHHEDKSVFYRAPDTTLPGGPDGMKVDQQGNLFVTGPGGILVLDSAGTHLGTISMPIPATNLAFGPKERELFITARSTVYRINMER